ncbi:hypothetical protein HLB44_20905 [Aquincola sp. S2]|uniref:PEP-CTERM protein-sorting domain-containing protein n=1 Tax=Pseudaquabacterium terrae TaxID=2732868 RepID=A0ABX2ELB1_9BURK|nr:hypothetical protein [Aquabacterium terrae]NRF69465.1 hypothetical protein [Aquabacterium terrae]
MRAFQAAACAALLSVCTDAAQASLIGDPYYAYFFHEYREKVTPPVTFSFYENLLQSGAQRGGTVFAVQPLGHSQFGLAAQGAVAAFDGGETFWADVISPLQGGSSRDRMGGDAVIHVVQSFRKDTPDANLSFTFSGGELQVMHYGSARFDGYHANARMMFEAFVVDHASGLQTWTEAQSAHLGQDVKVLGRRDDNLFDLALEQDHGPLASGMAPWEWSCDMCWYPAVGIATARLHGQYTGLVDLADIPLGGEFTLAFMLRTQAFDAGQGETGAMAFGRDPRSGDTGVSFELTGLTPTNNPWLDPTAVPEPASWALCLLAMFGLWSARRYRGS